MTNQNLFEMFYAPKDTKEVRCMHCLAWSPIELWADREPYCEDCGSHFGTECPICQHVYDHVWESQDIEFK